MVFYEQRPDDSEKPPGCLDVLVITRVVFGVLLVPVALMFGAMLDVALAFVLYAVHPALALVPVVVTVAAVLLYARWEQTKYRPDGL